MNENLKGFIGAATTLVAATTLCTYTATRLQNPNEQITQFRNTTTRHLDLLSLRNVGAIEDVITVSQRPIPEKYGTIATHITFNYVQKDDGTGAVYLGDFRDPLSTIIFEGNIIRTMSYGNNFGAIIEKNGMLEFNMAHIELDDDYNQIVTYDRPVILENTEASS